MEIIINKTKDIKLAELKFELKKIGLAGLGSFNINQDERYLEGFSTLLLLGPDEPKFWIKFKNSYEYKQNKKNPLDEWSKKNITKLAKKFEAKALFPFQSNPTLPFYNWALKTGQIWKSPVNLLIHKKHGLMVSFRGALAFNRRFKLNTKISRSFSNPCIGCSAPCITSCPVSALTVEKYEVHKCVEYVKSFSRKSCHEGCLVRMSCPIGNSLRQKEQSKFHMNALLRGVNVK